MTKRPTIIDVAGEAGVSTASVSRVLNGATVSADVAERVRAAVETLGYTPNALTRGVFAGGTSTIGVVIRDLRSPFYLELMRGIEEVAATSGSLVMYSNTFSEGELETDQVRIMDEHRVRGLIVTTGPQTDALTRRMAERGTPCVTVTRFVRSPPQNMHSIRLDNRRAGRLIGSHLHAHGRRSVGVITGALRNQTQVQRLEGIRHELGLHGLDVPDDRASGCESVEEAYAEARRIVSRTSSGRPVDALVCSTGRFMVGVYAALRDLGLRIPDDVALIGVDDFSWAAPLGITVIEQPAHAMGKLAAEMIVERRAEPTQKTLKPVLIMRGSCGEKMGQSDDG